MELLEASMVNLRFFSLLHPERQLECHYCSKTQWKVKYHTSSSTTIQLHHYLTGCNLYLDRLDLGRGGWGMGSRHRPTNLWGSLFHLVEFWFQFYRPKALSLINHFLPQCRIPTIWDLKIKNVDLWQLTRPVQLEQGQGGGKDGPCFSGIILSNFVGEL